MSGKRFRPLAERKPTYGPIPPAWKGETIVLVAAGPSLTAAQTATVRDYWCLGKCRVMVVNRGYELAPWADALYAADLKFWKTYIDKIRDANIDMMYSTTKDSCEQFGLWHVPGPRKGHQEPGLSLDPSMIHWGGHSGFQALNLAFHMLGYDGKVILLGYDCRWVNGKRHFHPDHEGMNNAQPAAEWPQKYADAMDDIKKTRVEVINATPDSRITCFPRMSIGAALSKMRATA